MAFTSLPFLGLVAVSLVAYYLLPKRCQSIVLLITSLVFYLSGGLQVLWYLLYTIAVSYGAGLLLGKLNEKKAGKTKTESDRITTQKKWVVFFAVLASVGLLFLTKYWGFTVTLAEKASLHLPRLNLLLPLGLSFYSFQAIGYVVDCYRGKLKPEKNFLKFSLFVSFFPQMVQGPISRFGQLAPQLTARHDFSADSLKYGIQLAMWGYLKKMIIADRASVLVNTVFDHPENYGGIMTALSVLFYCIQLYCDFSGGIDITRGVAQMFGIEMAENFRRPLFATSLADYWRRWHITLGTWMKDYVFYPLALSKPLVKLGKFTRRRIGGKLGKVIPTSVATFLIYFIIGIWHGASFSYIAYGFYNGIILTSSLLLAEPYLRVRNALHIQEKSPWFTAFRMARTMLIVFVGRYITRSPGLGSAVHLLWKTVRHPGIGQVFNGTVLNLGLNTFDLLVVVIGTALLICAEIYQERGHHLRKELENRNFFLQTICILLPMLILLLLGIIENPAASTEFIYKQF